MNTPHTIEYICGKYGRIRGALRFHSRDAAVQFTSRTERTERAAGICPVVRQAVECAP